MELERRIKTCRKSLQILESRLDSIPSLKNTVPLSIDDTANAEATETKSEAVVSIVNAEEHYVEESNLSSSNGRQDPRLTKYYRMLKVGVPLEAVKIKMISEDLNPNLLVL